MEKPRETEPFWFEGASGVRIVGFALPPEDTRAVREIVLFHHGLWVDLDFPPFQRMLINSLASEERIVFAYDARGHGKSCYDSHTGEFSDYFDPEAMVSDVTIALNAIVSKYGLVDRQGLSVTLVGHSLGGYVCLRAACEDRRISRVVAISAPLSIQFPKGKEVFERMLTGILVDAPERLFNSEKGTKEHLDLYKLRVRSLREAKKKLVGIPPLENYAPLLKVPVSFIIGKQDYFIDLVGTVEKTRNLVKLLPNSTLVLVEGEHGYFGVERELIAAVKKELGETGQLALNSPKK